MNVAREVFAGGPHGGGKTRSAGRGSKDAVRRRGVFDAGEVRRLKADFAAQRTDWPKPWLLMMVEIWCRLVLEAAPRARPEEVRTVHGG